MLDADGNFGGWPDLDLLLRLLDALARVGGALGAGCGKFYRARSRLYRNEILQENMSLKALAEICNLFKVCTALRSHFCQKFAKNFAKFCKIQQI